MEKQETTAKIMKKPQHTYLLKLDKDKFIQLKAQAKEKNLTFKAYILTHFIKL